MNLLDQHTGDAKVEREVRIFRYNIRLLIRHPTAIVQDITRHLNLLPSRAIEVGTPRETPKGRRLNGSYADTRWSYRRDIAGDVACVDEMRDLLNHLEPSANFLSQIKNSGGEIMLIVELPGDYHFGGVFTVSELLRLANLGIDLGIEIFPDMT